MAKIFEEISRTFDEYLLVPNLTSRKCTSNNIDLGSPLSKNKKGSARPLRLNIPIVSAIMQAVSNHTLAIELAKCGGLSFIYCSQPIEKQAEMIRKVKTFKAGFVTSDSNLRPDNTIADLIQLKEKTGHSTIAALRTASPRCCWYSKFSDYRVTRDSPIKAAEFMTCSTGYLRQNGDNLIEVTIFWSTR
jgi:IMP dehydrogenase